MRENQTKERDIMLKVAIAEDDFRIAQVQERFLQEIENVKVVGKALNAKEAIEMLEQEPIDLLILDIYMPDEMGTDLLPRIRERFPEVDVIVVTAATERDILERCLRNGVVNYLIKPVKMESFIEAIEGYQKKRSLLQARDEVDQSFVNSYFGYDKQQSPVEKVLPSGIDVVFSHWRGLMGPPNMTQEEIDYWNQAIYKMVNTKAWKQLLKENDFYPFYKNSSGASVFLERQSKLYEELMNGK